MPDSHDDNPNNYTRLVVLETKVGYIEGAVRETKTQLNEVDGKVDHISTHMAKQNGSLPRLEESITRLLDRVSTSEKETMKVNTKTKLVWGLASAVLTGVLLIFIKVLIGV